jgi:hypothetical protein
MGVIFRSASLAEFDAWHEKYKADHGYPLPGRNALTGEIQPLSIGPTTEYTEPIKIDDTDVRFLVEDKIAAVAPGKPSVPPSRKIDGTVDVLRSEADQAAVDAGLSVDPVADVKL